MRQVARSASRPVLDGKKPPKGFGLQQSYNESIVQPAFLSDLPRCSALDVPLPDIIIIEIDAMLIVTTIIIVIIAIVK